MNKAMRNKQKEIIRKNITSSQKNKIIISRSLVRSGVPTKYQHIVPLFYRTSICVNAPVLHLPGSEVNRKH